MLQPDGSSTGNPAQGDILSARTDLLLYGEEVPREGVRMTRSRHLARWIEGTTWLWTGYRRQIGHDESSSGLQFDQLAR
jgi:hypothetical protein